MTTSCPKCGTKLKDDYGMVTCPTCGVVLFVDMDGVAQAAGEEPDPLAGAPFNSQPMQPEPMNADAGVDSGANEPSPMGLEPVPFEIPGMEIDPVPENPPAPEPADGGGELDMGGFLGYDTAPTDSSKGAASQNDPNDPLGISAYANSELSSAKNGPLVVTVIISGIDTKDLRSEIRQAIQDSRFGWDAGAVMASIKGGTLVLPRISPVKASIVINRIKNLAVQIRWEQNAITELDISPTDSPS
jgi:hypothetical protein